MRDGEWYSDYDPSDDPCPFEIDSQDIDPIPPFPYNSGDCYHICE